ncbi:hypothetical protein NQZ68_022408 [Dissostichus eleginoides]|nr:hypothetical protein NQZ68_022408 [Dissostichus eleginoides]
MAFVPWHVAFVPWHVTFVPWHVAFVPWHVTFVPWHLAFVPWHVAFVPWHVAFVPWHVAFVPWHVTFVPWHVAFVPWHVAFVPWHVTFVPWHVAFVPWHDEEVGSRDVPPSEHLSPFSFLPLLFLAVTEIAAYEAYFGQGTKLTVLEPDHEVTDPTVKVFTPSPKECRNQRDHKRTKTLVCVASGFYPDHVSVSWQVGGGAVSSSGVATDSSALRGDKTYRISSRLRVSASDWFTEGRKFTCRVSFFNGTHTSHHEDTVEGVQVKEGVMTREKYLKTTQAAKLSYVVFIVKSSVYGAGVAFLLWRLQSSAGKQSH